MPSVYFKKSIKLSNLFIGIENEVYMIGFFLSNYETACVISSIEDPARA
jgi:hypothetical protein